MRKLFVIVSLLLVALSIQAGLMCLTLLEFEGTDYFGTPQGIADLRHLWSGLTTVMLFVCSLSFVLSWRPRWAFRVCIALFVFFAAITIGFVAPHPQERMQSWSFWLASVLPLCLLAGAVHVARGLSSSSNAA